MDIPYGTLPQQIEEGTLRQRLEGELTVQFEEMKQSGEPVGPSSWYATKIAEILEKNSEQPLDSKQAFNLYQEVAIACENAQRNVFGADEHGKPLRQ